MPKALLAERLFQENLPRRISKIGVCLLTANGLIGTGIFFLPSAIAAKSGAWGPLVFLWAGLALLPVVLVLSWLARAENSTGGILVYVERGFGPVVAEPMGWLQLIASLAGAAASFRMLMTLLTAKMSLPPDGVTQSAVMFLLMSGFVGVQCVGIHRAISFLGGVTILKILPLAALVLGAVKFHFLDGGVPQISKLAPGDPQLGDALFISVFACLGFEAALVPAAESKNPERDLGAGMIATYILVVGIYAIVQFICFRTFPGLPASKSPVVDTIAVLFGEATAGMLTYGLIFSVIGYVTTTFLTSGRYPYVLAKLNRLPRALQQIHPRFGTPWMSLVCFGACTWLFAISNGFLALVKITTLAKLSMLSLAVASWLRLQLRNSEKLPVARFAVCVLALLSCNFLIWCADWASYGTLLLLFSLFVAISYVRRYWRALPTNRARSAR